jgi:3-deoxy-D-manno-octulosonic-acid transferase
MGVYRFLTDVAAPGIALYLRARRAQGKEDQDRFNERLGRASLPRSPGPLVWCHAVSVGEATSVLSLIETIRKYFPAWQVLLTTGTVTSAKLLAGRLPKGTVHQYVPADRWLFVTRFLDHWRPDLALWVESELWPNMLASLRQREIPAVLLNGRLSEKSFRFWSLVKGKAGNMLDTFALILAQTEAERARFAALGGKTVLYVGNLKYAAESLPCDELELDRLRTQVGFRPVWLMASTHAGEDEIALAVHFRLRARWPNLLTIIVPRHAARGDSILKLIAKTGLRGTRRTAKKDILPATEVYLADTMGELGLFYRLAPVTCLGGSFVWGGHNPIEPAQLGCAVLFGPTMTNFAEIADELLVHHAALQVHSTNELALRLEQLLAAPEGMLALANVARALAEQKRGVLVEVLRLLSPWLERGTEASRESA